MAISKLNKDKLSEFKNLKAGWFDLGHGRLISEMSIDAAYKLLDMLPSEFEVFPLCDGFVQIEHSQGNKYLEIAVCDYNYQLYWCDMYDDNKPPNEGECVYWGYDEKVFDTLIGFINLFFGFE